MSKCFKLENSKYCPQFNGHYVLKRGDIKNTKDFDNTLKKYFENKDSYKNFLTDKFDCNNEQLPDFRYRSSFICNNYVVVPFTNNVNLCTNEISRDKNANEIPYCYLSCMIAVDSIEEILINNNYGCSQKKIKSNFNALKTSCQSDGIKTYKCLRGTENELKYCGYSNEFDKKSYCEHRKDITDSCCDDGYEIPDTIYSSESSSPSIIPTILFIIIVIASTILTIIFYIYKHKKTDRPKYQKQNDNEYTSTKLQYGEEGSSYSINSSENNLFYVFHEYIPKINDEIQLNIGDIVKVKKVFDDGWAYGTNISTDCEGALPLACCTEYKTCISSMVSFSIPLKPLSYRESSLITTN
ncbi:hypothetical protein H8356DRAFT_1313498 [Neocallimastix lanati (nom. inval.)]|jgi:hypothetical protein|nr:hypothetical protein H8356DRAFT_1313498 [Neocallimastix sp. JGI-2020a]